MSRENYRIVIGDLPDKEDPVADIYYKNQHVFQLFNENRTGFVVKFANNPNKNYWEFPYEEAIEVLQEAKDRLAKLQRTPEEQAEYEAKMEAQRKKYYE
jgi:hypothetical protein